MLDRTSALELVTRALRDRAPAHAPRVVREEITIEREWGWIFFYNSEQYITTGEVKYKLAGNGPVFVEKESGVVTFFGSVPPFPLLLEEYERKRKA